MELVDREKACQEILATRKYIEGPPENTQDNWVLQYLKERLRKDMNSSYEIWKEIFESRHGEDSNGWRSHFNRKWENLNDASIDAAKNHKIYFREIELINSCRLKTVWQKEALLILVYLFKFFGRKTFIDLRIDDCLKYIKDAPAVATPAMTGEALDEAVRVGLFNRVQKEQWDDREGEYYSVTVYEFIDHRQKDDIVCFEFWNAYDVSKYSGWFDSKLICEKCGKEFVGRCKIKRFVCDDCWKQLRREKAKQRMSRNRKCSHEC